MSIYGRKPDDEIPQGKLLCMRHSFQKVVDRIIAGLDELDAGGGNQELLADWFEKRYCNFGYQISDGFNPFQIADGWKEPEDIRLLNIYFYFFNKLLFMGALTELVWLRMFRFGQPELYSLEEKIGDRDEPQVQPRGPHYEGPFPGTLSCTIRVREIEDACYPEWRLRRYVSALLQNMIQAALSLLLASVRDAGRITRSSIVLQMAMKIGTRGAIRATAYLDAYLARHETVILEIRAAAAGSNNSEQADPDMERMGLEYEINWDTIDLTRRYLDFNSTDTADFSAASCQDAFEDKVYRDG